MSMFKAGVIGTGSMGRNHARVYNELIETDLVAIADVSSERAKLIASKYHCVAYTSHLEMLSKHSFDLISIAAPPIEHKHLAIDCIKKGIPVLIEKPLAPTVADCQEIIAAAGKAHVKIFVGHIERFNPVIQELKMRLDRNELGRILNINAERVGPYSYFQKHVDVTIDMAVHDIDVFFFLIEARLSRLFAETQCIIDPHPEDTLKAIFKFENNIIGSLNINWLTPTKIRQISVTGEKGMFVANYITQELLYFENKAVTLEIDYTDILRGVAEGMMIRYHIKKQEPLLNQIEYILKCIQNDTAPLVGGAEGKRAVEIALKLKESANQGKVITL